MSPLAERLADIREQLEHLETLRDQIDAVDDLRSDVGLRNDVLFALLVISQGVIDVAGELASRRGIRFQDYTEAVRGLEKLDPFPKDLVDRLQKLPGFRNVLVHDYVELDYDRVIEAVRELDDVREFVRIVANLEHDESH